MLHQTLLLLIAFTTTDNDPARPWLPRSISLDRAFEKETYKSTDSSQILAAAGVALEQGLLDQVASLEPKLEQVGKPLGDLLGLQEADGAWHPVELERYRDAAAATVATLAPPSAKTREQVLNGRFREIKLVNKSTYFDLWSDLPGATIQPYTDDLNGYYRKLRNRFRADLLGNIDVMLYGSRRDYLISYARSFGKSGESVLGFYVPSLRRLVFYDDIFNRDEIANTARHECTHLLIDLGFDGAPLPPWLHEGMACYMAAGGPDAAGEYTAGLVFTLARELNKQKLDINKLMKVDAENLKYEHYAWSWSLVHFLNTPKYAKTFQKFLDALRDAVNEKTDRIDCEGATTNAFDEAFDYATAQLQHEWLIWYEEELRIERPQQFVDFGNEAVNRASYEQDPSWRDVYLDVAAVCFANGKSDDATLENARAFGRLRAMVVRAEVSKNLDLAATRLLLRTLTTDIPALGPLVDESRKANLIRRSLGLLQRGLSIESTGSLRSQLVAYLDKRGPDEQEMLRSIAVLVDELMELSFLTLRDALIENPIHQPAAREWLFLAHDADRTRVRELFEYLELQVDQDPNDLNMAGLGLAYIDLDHESWGKHLIERATDLTPRPSYVEPFRQRANMGEATPSKRKR